MKRYVRPLPARSRSGHEAMSGPRTLYDKLWDSHVVHQEEDGQALLYIDRHLVNEVTSPQAFDGLRGNARALWRPGSIIATTDHNVPTDGSRQITDVLARDQVAALERNIKAKGALAWFPYRDPGQGIVHVIGPEMGATQPGMTIVCGDSHTSTHGAFAALAFGIGTSEVEHVLATQTLPMNKAKSLAVQVEGHMPFGVSAKDLALKIISRLGGAGASGHVIEFSGSTIQRLSMEGRMTLCNMAIEAGARSGLIGVDDTTVSYLKGRPFAPQDHYWNSASAYWRTFRADPGARYTRTLAVNADELTPQVTWGTSPDMVVSVEGRIPTPSDEPDPIRRASMERALRYMGLEPDTPISEVGIDKVFIGSCTNSRIEDLREAAALLKGRRVANNVRQALVVPGSGAVKRQAEAEGLDQIFRDAGMEWRNPGCSMCLGMNEDRLAPGERCASTSNRNFEGRQGAGGRSHLLSPAMAAAAAVTGRLCDARELM